MSTSIPSIVVFVGPTIGAGSVRALLQACPAEVSVRPPAARGDVLRAAMAGVDVVAVVDGFYESVPSTGHKEILWAVEQGVRVYGAASMGAIRAAECATFGMIGVGVVYEGFVSGRLDDDDVAVAHAGAEDGYAQASEAMVDIQATVDAGFAAGVIDDVSASMLVTSAKRRFYADRHWGAVEDAARQAGAGTAAVENFSTWRRTNGTVRAKRADAEALLARIVADVATGPPTTSHRRFRTVITSHFERQRAEAALLADDERHGDGATAVSRGLWRQPVVEELQVRPDLFRDVALEALRRRYARHAAEAAGGRPEASSVDAASDRIRRRLGLLRPDELWRWLEDEGLDFDEYSRMVERETLSHLGTALLPWLDPEDVLDVVRLRGLATALHRRSDRKAALLRAAGVEEAGHLDDGLVGSDALAWFCRERLGRSDVPDGPPLRDLAHALGFDEVADLVAAALRERRALDLGLDEDDTEDPT